ncbi:hypothetical protein B0H14DRAFT_2642620 [Mycena olivaceomarginata]|nr:hypothetical protein B0H14DRAFT_2642620 [Mycena olivaceomarginata]
MPLLSACFAYRLTSTVSTIRQPATDAAPPHATPLTFPFAAPLTVPPAGRPRAPRPTMPALRVSLPLQRLPQLARPLRHLSRSHAVACRPVDTSSSDEEDANLFIDHIDHSDVDEGGSPRAGPSSTALGKRRERLESPVSKQPPKKTRARK